MFFKLSQDVSNRFSLNRFNEFSLKSRLYIVWSAWFLGEKDEYDKYDWEMIRHNCFDYSTFKIIINDGIADLVGMLNHAKFKQDLELFCFHNQGH